MEWAAQLSVSVGPTGKGLALGRCLLAVQSCKNSAMANDQTRSSNKVSRQTVLGLFLLLVIAGVVWWLLSGALDWFKGLSPNVAAALVTAVAAIASILYTQRQNKIKDIAEAHRSAKVELYKRFMEFVTKVLVSSDRTHEERFGTDFQNEFIAFTSELVIWGSPDVLHKFGAWRTAAQQNDTPALLLAVDDLLRAIRTDLQNNNKTLRRGDLMKQYLKDPNELTTAINARPAAGVDIPDEAAMFIAVYGPPTEELNTENDTPRPLVVTRMLTYLPENVRAIFVPFGSFGARPPYSGWKFVGTQDAISNASLDPGAAAERLKSRKRDA